MLRGRLGIVLESLSRDGTRSGGDGALQRGLPGRRALGLGFLHRVGEPRLSAPGPHGGAGEEVCSGPAGAAWKPTNILRFLQKK